MAFIFVFFFSRASDFGLMKIDGKGRVMSFSEKPKGKELKAMVSALNTINSNTISFINL